MKFRKLLSIVLVPLLLLSALPAALAAPAESGETEEFCFILSEDGELTAVPVEASSSEEASLMAEVTLGGLRYQISGNTVTVTGYTDDMPAALTIPGEIELDRLYTVTQIAAQAFSGCTKLTAVAIPATVEGIGAQAFDNTPSLTSITVAAGNTRYSAADGVLFDGSVLVKYPSARPDAAYAVPGGTTVIAGYAFWGAAELTEVAFPDTLAEIQSMAFTKCTGIRALTLPEGVKTVGSFAFQNCRLVSAVLNGIRSLGQGAFQSCTALETVSLPASLETLGTGCFTGCTALRDISVAKDCADFASVDGVLFNSDCSQLLVYPNASPLTEFTVPKNVTALDAGVFASAKALTALKVEAGSTAYSAIDGVLFSADGTVLFAYPYGKAGSGYTVPAAVTEIGAKAFYQNPSLTEIALNRELRSIGSNAFASAKLQAVALPDTLETIGQNAFIHSALTSVTLPASVASVGRQAFDYCSRLNDVEFCGAVPGKLSMVFTNCTALRTVYVPVGTLRDYQTALSGSLPASAAVVEGGRITAASVLARINSLAADAPQAEVNALVSDYVRLSASEKALLPDEALQTLDEADQRVNPVLHLRVDTADSSVSVSAAGLAPASGETAGSVVLDVNEVKNDEAVLDLRFSMTVNNVSVQPLGPVLLSVSAPADIARLGLALYRVSGKTMTPVPFRQAGRSLIFRADSLGEYLFVDATRRSMDFRSALLASVSSTGEETPRLIAARYVDGRMAEVLTPVVELAREERSVRLNWSTTENSTFKLFWMDENGVPIMEAVSFGG